MQGTKAPENEIAKPSDAPSQRSPHTGVLTVLVALAYVITGYVGFTLALPPGNVSILWPPSGIAMAAIFLWGNRSIPGILIGAAVINGLAIYDGSVSSIALAPIIAAIGISIGSALQPLAGRYLVRRFGNFDSPFEGARGIMISGGIFALACTVSATIGTTSLYLAGLIEGSVSKVFFSWWLGDYFGVLCFMPLVLSVVRQSRYVAAALIAVATLSFGGVYFVSDHIRSEAESAWDNQASREAERLTTSLVSWLETASSPVNAMSAVIKASDEVYDDEFLNAALQLEDYQPDFFPRTLGVATPVAGTTASEWEVAFSTDNDGPLSVGAIIGQDSLAHQAIRASLNEPERMIIGEFGSENGHSVAISAVAITVGGLEQVVFGVLDLTQMFDGLFAVQVPSGFHLHVFGAPSGGNPENLVPIYGHGHGAENVIVTKNIRGTSGNALFTFRWDITDQYLPGSRSTLANALLVGGIFGSAALLLFFTFILGQNEKIRQRVRERTTELSQQKAILESTMEAIDQGITMFDREFNLLARNAEFNRMFDIPLDKFPVGTNFEELLRYNAERGDYGEGDVEQMVRDRLNLAKKFEPHRFERTLPNGKTFEVRGNPLPDNSGFVTTYTDITERKKSEQEIAMKESLLRMALENMPGGIAMIDGDLRIQLVNDTYCELYGHPRETYAPGTPIADVVRKNVEAGIHKSGDHVTGDIDATVQRRIDAFKSGVPGDSERELPNGRILHVRHNPIEGGGVVLIATDVTERRMAELEMEAKQEQLAEILNNVQQGVVLWDTDKKPIAWNDRFPEALAVDPKLLDAPGFDVYDMAEHLAERGHYGDGDKTELARARIDTLWSGNHRSEVSFDKTRTFDVLSNRTPSGRVVVTYTDITERKAAEKEIASQEAQIRAIVESVPDAVVTIDSDGTIQTVNKAAENIFEYAPGELIGKDIKTLMPEEYAVRHDGFMNDYIRSGNARFIGKGPRELSGKRKSGDVFPIDISIAEAATERGRVFVGVLRDITARKEAERIIAEKEAQLRAIIDNIQMVIILKDRQGRHLAANNYYETATGVPPDVIIGKRDDEFLPIEAAQQIMSMDQKVIESGKLHTFEETVPHPDGTMHSYLTTKVPVFDEAGNVDTIVVAALDITERKKAQEEIAEKEAMLSAALENMTGGLFMIDAEMKLRVFNERFSEYYNIPRDVFEVGVPLADVLRVRAERGDYGEGDPEELLRARLDGYRNRQVQIVTDIVDDRIIEVYRAPMEDGGMVCVFNDVTERKQAEEALSRAHSLITESLSYASRIQRSLLPPRTILEEVFKSHVMIWEPKDQVGGDMIWLRPADKGVYIIVADCTGHGPPGAFMTMICTGALDQSLAELDTPDPAKVLSLMNKKIKTALGQNTDEGESDDGVELGVCHVDPGKKQVTFAGARFSLVVVQDSSLEEIKGKKSSIGYRHVPTDIQFENHTINYNPDMQFYMWSDGLVDQIGGPRRRSFGKRRLQKIVLDYHKMDMTWQASQILREFEDYQHDETRRDDITFFGFIPKD